MRNRYVLLVIAVVVAALVMLLAGCDEDSVERQLGNMTVSAVEHSYRVDNDPLVHDWVNGVGMNLVACSQRQNIPFEYKVIQADDVNAFAAPYGHVYICEGLLDFAKSEDEVVAVLGHETGHVVNRHVMKSVKKDFLYSVGLGVLAGKSEGAANIGGVGVGLLSLKYSRDDERQADDYGTMLAYRSGHDPQANIAFFTRLMTDVEKNPPSKFEQYFLTHPDTASRITRQKLRPENDPNNATALMHIARGYMRRAQYAHAIPLLDKAAALQPQSAQPRILLADAYSARGQYAKAAQLYQEALQLDGGNEYAKQSLQLASATHAPQLPPIGEAERLQAKVVLASANTPQMQPEALRIGIKQLVSGVSQKIAPVTASSREMTSDLVSLGEDERDMAVASQQAVVEANAAIHEAFESTYQLEASQERLAESGGDLVAVVTDTRALLQQAAEGKGRAGDVAVLSHTATEAARAVAELAQSVELAKAAVPAAQSAHESARDTLGLVRDIMNSRRESSALNNMAGAATRETNERSLAALEAVDKAKKTSTQAQVRTLVARINLAALGADSALQRAYDALVGGYMMSSPAKVAQLRQQGLGYGDAAVCLAVCRSGGLEATEFATLGLADNSMVDAAVQTRVPLHSASLLLKFLAETMETEGQSPAKRS
jgi:predicted Zn-dependent protease